MNPLDKTLLRMVQTNATISFIGVTIVNFNLPRNALFIDDQLCTNRYVMNNLQMQTITAANGKKNGIVKIQGSSDLTISGGTFKNFEFLFSDSYNSNIRVSPGVLIKSIGFFCDSSGSSI